MSKIRFSSNILKRLGEELNPGIDKGILELVKNAYDADAESCIVDIGTGEAGGTLTVSDDGDGMDINDIDDGWLVLGNSRKTHETTRLGRIPAGSKGLGRLAALRMGHKVEMTSVSINDRKNQYSLSIDWDYYDREDLVDDVELTIDSWINEGKTPGTEIKILELRENIHRADIKKLAREMLLLADPFSDVKNSFNPVLIAPEFEDLEKLVQRRYFDDAEYYLEAELSNNKECTLSVKDWLGNVLFSGSMNNLKGPYKTISFRFEIWTFILNNKNFLNRTVTISEIRTWLKDFGGIHFYQNGLRVSPYGDKGNDWLDLNLQRVRSPEERPSTNNTIGRVSVTADESVLIPKTDRSGFIENETFRELHRFCTDALDWMAKQRLAQAEKRRANEKKEVPKALKKTKDKMLSVIINTAEGEDKEKLHKAFTAYDKARQKEADALQNELLLYRTLSTAGITAATFAHEMLGEHLKNGSLYISILKNKIKKETQIRNPEDYLDKLNKLNDTFEAIKIPGQTTLSLIEHEKRRRSKIEVHEHLFKLVDEFQAFYDSRNTNVETNFLQSSVYIYATISAFESIIVNLIVNGLSALEQIHNKTRKIIISTVQLKTDEIEISIVDNGSGITGLGLTIVKDTVKDLGGTIDVQAKTEFGGAKFTVILPTI